MLLIIILSIVIKGWHNIILRSIETIQTSEPVFITNVKWIFVPVGTNVRRISL